jgi:uncharacterized protein YceH (UPF0502 family)
MHLEVRLEPHEARLFGVLIEKAFTTPDQYPLTLNAAVNGANQKTNRDPVLSLDEYEVAVALENLVQKNLARRAFLGNSRVEKYTHRGGEMLGLAAPALATVAELLMRGPQTLGELRGRVSRMTPLASLDEASAALQPLIERGYAKRLDPLPGSRAERYVQLIAPDLHPLDAPSVSSPSAGVSPLAERVTALEQEVERLRRAVERLAALSGQTIEE